MGATPGTPVKRVPTEHVIEVTEANGILKCIPDELERVLPGDSIIWKGPRHSGRVTGKIVGAKQRKFTAADLKTLEIDKTHIPFNGGMRAGEWSTDFPKLTVAPDARKGAYKYVVTITGKPPLDPVIIVEEPGGGGDEVN
jgi:hypothetical protein